MRNPAFALLIISVIACIASPLTTQQDTDINAKVARLDIDTATLEDVINIFGEPQKHIWGRESFTKNNLPERYIALYPDGFQVFIADNRVVELRFEHVDSGYTFAGKIRVGSLVEEVLEALGQPTSTITGQENKFTDGVLFRDIDGQKGHCYYGRSDKGVRLFFADYKVTALYVTRTGYDAGTGGSGFQTVRPVDSVAEFDDVRWKDLSKLPLGDVVKIVDTLRFNEKTVWPDTSRFPPAKKPSRLLDVAKNPGLGVDRLHRQGITGKGVNVAIIDQPLYQDHPEFNGKIVAYHDVGCGSESSMHGPAVASLLVGNNCGTAPDAKLYYVAAPSWTKDTAYQAKALDWLIEQNEKLHASEKIRVVSVSAAPSGPGSPFDKNNQMWDTACEKAEAAGMLVLDCTSHHGFIGPCYLNARLPENPAQCTPGFPDSPAFTPSTQRIHAPTCPRTTAEQYEPEQFSYQYCGKGGLSWAIPYVAGVLAMGWQINPDLSAEQMKQLLFESAHTKTSGAKIINPQKFILLVRKAKPN